MVIYSILQWSGIFSTVISKLCGDCKVQEIWDSTCVISGTCM